jgi:hypothetical protein
METPNPKLQAYFYKLIIIRLQLHVFILNK